LEPLVKLISAKANHGEDVVIWGLRCLVVLTKTHSIRVEVVQMDVLDHLRKLLEERENLEVRRPILHIIGSVAAQEDNQVVIYKKKCLPSIMKQAESDDPQLKYVLARALANIGLNAGNQAELGGIGVVNILLALTQACTPEIEEEGQLIASKPLTHIQEEAVRALWNVCGYAPNRESVREAGGVEMVCDLLRDSKEIKVQSQCAGAIGNLALEEDARKILTQYSAPEMLMELCYEEDLRAQRNAAGALSNLALDDECRADIMVMGGVETMLNICKGTDTISQRGAAGTLWNLAIEPSNRQKIDDEGGMEVLLTLSHPENFTHPEVQEPAAGCLSLLAMEPQLRERLIKLDALPQIVHLSKSPHDGTQTCAAEIIEAFLLDEHLEMLQGLGAIEALQMYARSIVKRRRLAKCEKQRPVPGFQPPPESHSDKGDYSTSTPPPRYRPITPAPLYEIDAMEWWPNTQGSPLSRMEDGQGDPYMHAGEYDELDMSAPPDEPQQELMEESKLFFHGKEMMKPHPKTEQSLGQSGRPSAPGSAMQSQLDSKSQTPLSSIAASKSGTPMSAMRSKLGTPQTAGSMMSGRGDSRGSAPRRFYF